RCYIIETEANSSATIGLALFACGYILKNSIVRCSSSLLYRSLIRKFRRHINWYIPTRKSFSFDFIWYIPRHKSFTMNESVVYTGGRGIQAPMGGFSLHPTHRDRAAMNGAPRRFGRAKGVTPTMASLL